MSQRCRFLWVVAKNVPAVGAAGVVGGKPGETCHEDVDVCGSGLRTEQLSLAGPLPLSKTRKLCVIGTSSFGNSD